MGNHLVCCLGRFQPEDLLDLDTSEPDTFFPIMSHNLKFFGRGAGWLADCWLGGWLAGGRLAAGSLAGWPIRFVLQLAKNEIRAAALFKIRSVPQIDNNNRATNSQ